MMKIKNKNVLITGANGFIGSYLVDKLNEKGYNVSILIKSINSDRRYKEKNKIKIIIGDIKDKNLNLNSFNLIYHLAALTNMKECYDDPQKAFKENVEGTINLITKMNPKCKFVYISTLGVYGEPKYFPVNEDHPTYPIEPYAASKLAAENFIMGYCKSRKLNYCIARLFNVYGPKQNTEFLIPKIITQIIRSNKIQLNNLDSTRDFIYIDDVIEALYLISEHGKNDIYNVGTGKETSVGEIIELLKKITHNNIKQEIFRKRGFKNSVRRSVADITKIEKDIGWHPSTNINDGLIKTWGYYNGASRINR